jgi:glycosyltransferase involved in cell wall biosynthesis
MKTPTVSIIIPAYNNATYLTEAIQSVLDQTYPHFELIVVNDASPDHTSKVVRQFNDPRIRYLIHEQNRGLSAARNTGIRASRGELVALLDGDDLFHPRKLREHVDFLEKHPEIGVSYNSRFELDHSARTIRELWRPPLTVALRDLIFIYPFSPSDMVLRRDWAFKVNLFDESHTYVGEDLDLYCRLAMAGCKFASVDRALNYRRYHSRRVVNVRSSVEDTIRPLNSVFADPKCPKEVLALKGQAFSHHYLLWSVIAFTQDDTAIGQRYCSEAVRLNPPFAQGRPSELVNTLLYYSIVDESLDHTQLLPRLFEQLPAELSWQKEQFDWALARGYLLKGTRDIIWGRIAEGRKYFELAGKYEVQLDQLYLNQLTQQLLNYEVEFGPEAARKVFHDLSPFLQDVGGPASVRRLNGTYSINLAFRNYETGKYLGVPSTVMQAISNDPRLLANRGVLAILIRSLGFILSLALQRQQLSRPSLSNKTVE